VSQVRERGYTLVGDVHPGEAAAQAGHLTPVPGGIGPLTIACLLRNTLRAARLRRRLVPQ
jgi:methylenetetrahydrofolate dehydrogenase (NADP+)/methenyltetrahydrofolate cyclohydrolase